MEKDIKILRHLHLVGILEGISSGLLFFIAMPIKYIYDAPWATREIGLIHGILFVWYIAAVLFAGLRRKWKFGIVLQAFVASIFPLGTFLFDIRVKKELRSIQA